MMGPGCVGNQLMHPGGPAWPDRPVLRASLKEGFRMHDEHLDERGREGADGTPDGLQEHEPAHGDIGGPEADAGPDPAEGGIGGDAIPSSFKSGFVAIAGPPNVGKSTLMNRFISERLAIVTAKPQTTRRRTLGILNGPGHQVVLLDTPGLMEPRYALQEAMLLEAVRAVEDADLVLFMAEPRTRVELPPGVAQCRAPRVLVLNKIDTARHKDEMLPVLDQWGRLGAFEEIVPISALTGDGVDRLLAVTVDRLPHNPPFYPQDQIADQPERFFVAEIVRERLFELYQQEVPYSTEVVINEFVERPGAKDFIEAWIYVEHESQKAIVIGRKGAAIRNLGEEARRAIEAFLSRPVYLSLRVRVLPKWRKRKDSLRKLGYRS